MRIVPSRQVKKAEQEFGKGLPGDCKGAGFRPLELCSVGKYKDACMAP